MSLTHAPQTVQWIGDLDGHLRLLDQTLLPGAVKYRDCRTVEDVWEAIRSLQVRGAQRFDAIVAAARVGQGQGGHCAPSFRGRVKRGARNP